MRVKYAESIYNFISRDRLTDFLFRIVVSLCFVMLQLKAAYSEDSIDYDALYEIQIRTGKLNDICHELTEGFREAKLPTSLKIHETPLPSKNPNFKKIEWTEIDPLKHLDVIRDYYFWMGLNKRNVPSIEIFNQQIEQNEILPELLKTLWEPAKDIVINLVKTGKITLSTARFDMDYDGFKEDVYRITPFRSFYQWNLPYPEILETLTIEILDIQPEFSYGLPGGNIRYTYYTPRNQVERMRSNYRFFIDSRGDYFYWKGRAYYMGGSLHIAEPDSRNYSRPKRPPVCTFAILKRE